MRSRSPAARLVRFRIGRGTYFDDATLPRELAIQRLNTAAEEFRTKLLWTETRVELNSLRGRPLGPTLRRGGRQLAPALGGDSVFAFSPEVRKILYTTNAIESLHSQVRKAIRNKGHFPSDEAATKLIFLALRSNTAKWKNAPRQ